MIASYLAGCRRHARNRETGTVTEVFEAAAQRIDADDRWVAVCRDHGAILSVPTLGQAHYFAAHPTEFCEDCREEKQRG